MKKAGDKFEFISRAELARRLEVSPRTIWKWSKTGHLPLPKRLSDGTTRYDLAEVSERLDAAPRAYDSEL